MDKKDGQSKSTQESERSASEADDPPRSRLNSQSPTLQIHLSQGVSGPIDVTWLHDRLIDALVLIQQYSDKHFTHVGIAVVNSDRMKELNDKHLGKLSTTDVLSFDLSENSDSINAEVIVCADVAQQRAREFGHQIEQELLLYAIHGLLHCAGFDDNSAIEAQTMHDLEDRILEQIGVGRTYQPERSAP